MLIPILNNDILHVSQIQFLLWSKLMENIRQNSSGQTINIRISDKKRRSWKTPNF